MYRTFIALMSLTIFVVGCGGGGSGSGTAIGGGSLPEVASPSGAWDDPTIINQNRLIAFIDSNNDALFYWPFQPMIMRCELTVNSQGFSCDLGDDFYISGTVEEGVSLSGVLTLQDIEQHSFNLNYPSEVYDNSVSLSQLVDVWSEESAGIIETLSIDSDGAVTGSDSSGCVVNGQLTMINTDFNLHDVSLTYSNCANKDGVYLGKGFFVDSSTTSDPSDVDAWRIFLDGTDLIKDSLFERQ